MGHGARPRRKAERGGRILLVLPSTSAYRCAKSAMTSRANRFLSVGSI